MSWINGSDRSSGNGTERNDGDDEARFAKGWWCNGGDGHASGGSWRAILFFHAEPALPRPALEILDPSFLKYRRYSSTLEQVGTGMRWAEGPVYFPEGGYLLVS